MDKATKSTLSRPSSEIYRSFVLSVFSDYRLLLIGVPTSVVAVLLTAYTDQSIYLYAIAAAMFIIGVVRYFITSNFHKEIAKKAAGDVDYRRWEARYTFIAITHASTFGLWCLASTWGGSSFAMFVSFSVTFGNLIGVCGRCFPISRLVNGQLLAVAVPLVTGLFLQGGIYTVLAAMFLPYLIGLRSIAAKQRENLLNNVVNRRKAESLATQFNTALENVPHGICMFDSNGKLEVANGHIGSFIDRNTQSLKGVSILQLVDLLQNEFSMPAKNAVAVRKWIEKPGSGAYSMTFEMGTSDRRTIKFRASRMENGGIIATFEDISREVRASSQIDHLTRFDRLTGLMNRNQLPGFIDQQLTSGKKLESCSVILVNIDRFKQINDTLGHSVGDALLCGVTDRLKELAEGSGTCGRLGGDEFVVVTRSEQHLDVATNMADLISESISKPFDIDGRQVHLKCSVGIALQMDGANDSETLLKNADLAMMAAKRDGKGGWRIFNADMSRELQARRQLESDLRDAITNNQLEAHFQPLVSVKEKRVTVCEALLRWKHPVRGHVPPYEFIPIAEDIGLIVEIGSWMLFEACKTCASWPDGIRVAVNLSPLQFQSGDIVETVRDALAASGLEASRLELEITESLMLDNVQETIGLLNQFKKMGVRISLDDFGTGYSSLSYMNDLPLDKVKIDRSFVMDLDKNSKSLTLVQAVTALGQKLGLGVVVEGIETKEQLNILVSNAPVDEIQGYLFSKPVSGEDLKQLLDRSGLANRSMLANLKGCKRKAA